MYLPDSKIRLIVWLQFVMTFLARGVIFESFFLRTLSSTLCRRTTEVHLPNGIYNGLNRVHECDRRQTDRPRTLWRNV